MWIKAYWENWYKSGQSVAMPLKNTSFILKYKTTILDSEHDTSPELEASRGSNDPATECSPYMSRLVRNERATSDSHWQNTRLLEFNCANTKALEYAAGDVLMLRPSNLPSNVKKFYETFAHLNLERVKSKPLKVELNYQDMDLLCVPVLLASIGSGSAAIKTVGDLVERYFDLNGKPRMSFFEMLAELATDELEKGKLLEFCNATNDPEGSLTILSFNLNSCPNIHSFIKTIGLEELNNYCYKSRRTIIEVLCDFPRTCENITSLDILLELIPSISPRAFSIASSPHVHRDRIQLLVAVVEYKTRLVETRKGTCSYWLNTLDPLSADITVPVWIKKGSFSIEWSKPLICIGPGTGVAPMRSILNERIVHLNQGGLENCLYFGCRSGEADFYFKDEWKKCEENGQLELNVAFSQQHVDKKVYVQDLMLEKGARVFELLDKREACVLIAGSSGRMPKDVLAILEKIVRQHLVRGEGEDIDQMAEAYVKRLELQKRIQLETWS